MAATGTGGGTTGGYTGYTGMTGMRTGTASRPMPTTRPTGTGGRIPTKGSGYGSKFTEMWNNLDPKHKTLIIAGVIGLLLLSITVQIYSKSNEFVALYDTPLSQQDIPPITQELNKLGIKYKLSTDKEPKILIHPSLKASTQMSLAQMGLPRIQVPNSMTPSEEGMKIKTVDEISEDQRLRKQGDLIMSIRTISGVADATVQIVKGDESSFLPDNVKDTTAAIMIRMQPGSELTPMQVNGIVNLVAFSVKGLKPTNVVIVNQDGIELTKRTEGGELAMGSAGLSAQDQERQAGIQKRLETDAQEMLDKVLGPGKSMVKVNVELENSQSEIKTEQYENGVTTVKSTETESLKNSGRSSLPGATQMGGLLSARKAGSDYNRSKLIEKNQPNSVITRKVTAPGSIKKLSVGVFVDNLREEQLEKVQSVIKGVVGCDTARGDVISVESMPFSLPNSVLDRMRSDMTKNSAGYSPFAHNGRQNWAFYLMFFPLAILAGIMAIFLMKQRRVVADQSRMIFSEGPSANATDIADLLTDKIGKPSFAPPTQVNTTEELEKLAKEKPTKVAELLKSTWLAEKGR